MPRTSVQQIPRKKRLNASDLTRLIRKKKYGALVAYNFANFVRPHNGWYAYFTNKPEPDFIGANWVAAHESITQLPDCTPFRRLISNLTGGAL